MYLFVFRVLECHPSVPCSGNAMSPISTSTLHSSLPHTRIPPFYPHFRCLRPLLFSILPTSISHSLSSQRVYKNEQKSGKGKGEKGGEEEEEEEGEEENEEEKEEGEERQRRGKGEEEKGSREEQSLVE